MALSPGTRLGPYEILGPLGSGGMGEVYRARDTRLGRAVALKTIPAPIAHDPTRRARLEREAQALSAISHAHVCALYDIGEHDGLLFLVMELVEGEPLETRLRRGPMPYAEVLRAAIQLADALEEAHGRGLVHRDLKPSNVKLTPAGVKLLDFGLARPVPAVLQDGRGPDIATSTLTAEGQLLGTVQYMAPEQLQGLAVDARTDIFALGVLLYEMASGSRPFPGQNAASQIAAILTQEPGPLDRRPATGVPPAFDHVIRRCLAKLPDDRWQSARDVRLELEWLARQAESGLAPARGPQGRVRRAVLGGTACVLLTTLAVTGTLATMRRADRRAPPPTTAMRFLLPPPEGTQFQAAGHFMAVSPDGGRLAFVAMSAGERLLWVRAMGELDARPLPGTENAAQPFWSPDSTAVAFFADRTLKKVQATGGAPQVIAEVADGLAGTWSRAGDILFPAGGNQPLMRVSAHGGQPVPATTLDPRRGEVRHSWPVFLPDGRHFLFLAVSSDPQTTGVRVGTLGEPGVARVLAAKTNVAYVEPGYLVWREGGRLLAQPFDSHRLVLTGEPQAIAEDVAYSPVSARGAFSLSDTGTLVFMPAPTGRLVWYDRRGSPRGFVGEPSEFHSPALSPDGSHLAVGRQNPETATSDIWVYDLKDGSGLPLTGPPPGDMALWSPDGQRILFRSGAGPPGLYIRSLASLGREQPATRAVSGIEGLPVAWTPDATRVIVESPVSDTRRFRANLLTLAGGAITPLVDSPPHNQRFVKLSRDGRWMAYASDESGRAEIYVETFPRSRGKWQVSSGGGVEPHWRADGRELYYLDLTGMLAAVPVRVGPSLSAGPVERLFQTKLRATIGHGLLGRNQYDVTPDGQRFVINETAKTALTVVVGWPALLDDPRR